MPTKRRPIDFRKLRDKVSPLEVLALIGWKPNYRCGLRSKGPCPLHGSESRTSRVFKVDGSLWYCFKCRVGGDATELYRRIAQLDPLSAAVQMCDELRVEIPFIDRPR